MKNKAKENNKNLRIRNIVIARGFRASLKSIKNPLWRNVLNAIECGGWLIPFESYEYLDIKKHLETKVFHKFFKLPKSLKISIKSFDSDILSYFKGH